MPVCARDIMTRDVAVVPLGTPVAEAIRLMLDRHVSGLPVLDAKGRVAGIVTEGDLLHRAELDTARHRPGWLEFLRGPGARAEEYARTHGRLVDEVMTREIVAAEEEAPVADVVSLMERHRIKRIPILRQGRLAGVVSRADLLRQLLNCLDQDEAKAALSDDEIERRLRATLAAEGWAPRIGLRVSVQDGIVLLDGVIYDERERQGLRVAAETIPGVRGVEDRMVWIDPTTAYALTGMPRD